MTPYTPGQNPSIPSELRRTVDELKAQVAALHAELPRNDLVVWTAGNVSARVPGADLLVIKPSGVSYDELTPEAMVVCDFDATLVEGDRKPSSDTVKAAVMVEDVARTVHLARQLGEPKPIAQSDIDKLFERYQNVYGQH